MGVIRWCYTILAVGYNPTASVPRARAQTKSVRNGGDRRNRSALATSTNSVGWSDGSNVEEMVAVKK
jgi:hypothetical protein